MQQYATLWHHSNHLSAKDADGKQYNHLDRTMAKGQETKGGCGRRGF